MTNKRDYLQGYQDALQGLEEYITLQIKRNGGATNMLQVLNVFNATLAQLHSDLAETRYELEQIDEQNSYTSEEIIQQIMMSFIKGGK